MRTLFSRAIQIDPSFHVALGVLVIFAIAEVFFATSYYVGRARANRVAAQPVTPTIARAPATSSAPALAPAAAQPSVSPPTAVSAPPTSIVDQLLREGKEFRERGDTTNALARFQEALDQRTGQYWRAPGDGADLRVDANVRSRERCLAQNQANQSVR